MAACTLTGSRRPRHDCAHPPARKRCPGTGWRCGQIDVRKPNSLLKRRNFAGRHERAIVIHWPTYIAAAMYDSTPRSQIPSDSYACCTAPANQPPAKKIKQPKPTSKKGKMSRGLRAEPDNMKAEVKHSRIPSRKYHHVRTGCYVTASTLLKRPTGTCHEVLRVVTYIHVAMPPNRGRPIGLSILRSCTNTPSAHLHKIYACAALGCRSSSRSKRTCWSVFLAHQDRESSWGGLQECLCVGGCCLCIFT